MKVTSLKRLWTFLSVFGPAPAGKAAEGPKSLEPAERGMFDDPEGEPAGEEPRAELEQEEEPEGEPEEEAPEADEPEGDEAEQPEANADEDEDEDETPDEDEDEEDDTALTLQRSWETRLEAEARTNPEGPPRLQLGAVKVREAARKRFAELQEEGADKDPEAIFEIAMDAALQVVGAYHDDVAHPAGDRVEKSLRNVQVGRTLSSFRKAAGANLTEALEQKMGAKYTELVQKYGWRRADTVPLKDLFRMVGGRMKKGAKAAPEAAPEAKARLQKKEALGAASGPRALGRTRPDGGAAPAKKEDRALREFSQDVRTSKPFFSFG